MSRIKLILLTATVAVVSMLATASASQAHEFLVEGKPIVSPEHFIGLGEELGGPWVFLGKPFAVAVHILCSHVHYHIGLLPEGKSTFHEVFSLCTVTKPANCTVKEIIILGTDQLVLPEKAGEPLEDEFAGSGEGGAFVTIQLEGSSCAFKEPFTITGKQRCRLPGSETEAVSHEVECKTSGSKLIAGGASATFEGTWKAIELEGKKKYSAK